MVNNAGASFRANPEDITPNGWNTVVQINLNGVFFGCKWAGRQMMAQGGGVIINVSSIAGVSGSTMMSHYGAAKAAVINYMGVLTKQDPAVAKKAYDTVASRVGMGRWGKVEEIAYPCIFLASDASAFMTGATIIVDGGASPQLGDG
jgi:3-oxoacyl-[acyl-carrier protein] reductase